MKLRWKVLIAVGLSVAVLDQWTKFLVVKHITPGIAYAHQGNKNPLSAKAQEELLAGLSAGQQFKYFYTNAKKPCAQFTARCPTVKVIDGFWNWRYVENPGAAWGLLANASPKVRVPFFVVISVLAIIFIIRFFTKLEDSQHLLIWSLSLVFGGAIGNFIDRLHLNYVIDFIDWYVGTSHWPTFNVADVAISCGVGLLILEWLLDVKRQRENPENSAQPSA